MIPLKRNFSYLVLDDQGQINADSLSHDFFHEAGAYFMDTRLLSVYRWNLDGFRRLSQSATGSHRIVQYWSQFEDHRQLLLIVRTLQIHDTGFVDELKIVNTDSSAHAFTGHLSLASDFADIFEVRGHDRGNDIRDITYRKNSKRYSAKFEASDGVSSSVQVALVGFKFDQVLTIKPRSSRTIRVEASFECDVARGALPEWLGEGWLGSNTVDDPYGVYEQAESDLHDLLLATDDGLTLAAGIPWFVTPFGRDSIISSWFLLHREPRLAEGTLRFLAANQGRVTDAYRDEQPGKILHEKRYSELSRVGELPFHTYFGTADATPLFLILLHDHWQATGGLDLIQGLKPNWLAALDWMEAHSDERGLIVFSSESSTLSVQSWKDSYDSLSYRDGTLGEGRLAVAEVQGYAYAAYQGAATLYQLCGDDRLAAKYSSVASALKMAFHSHFWMPEHNNFAIALDQDGRRLDINSSDSGHLLWTGIVDDALVDVLVERLFADDIWSGWGLRTLSASERRYNPISYHNGSVWPHDTALFAAGLWRHGKLEEFERVRRALIEVAAGQPDRRLPELFAGFSRSTAPVLPYPEACRPQAWSAASLIYLMGRGKNEAFQNNKR